jgi:DNA-directed RNA polymerase subunit RPC12/RpoP
MADSISKHDAYTTLKDLEAAYIYPPVKEAHATAARRIDQIKPADVQPVKHGYWEEVIDYGGWGDTHYRCSVCGEEWYLEDGKPKDNNMNFCPRCGARMDGDTNG